MVFSISSLRIIQGKCKGFGLKSLSGSVMGLSYWTPKPLMKWSQLKFQLKFCEDGVKIAMLLLSI
jgi:hypothetical protein